MQEIDVLVVGCGLSGAAVARVLAEKEKKVKIIERRNHIAGNMYDYVDEHGILVHKYGPHTFHTTEKKLFDFIDKYGDWVDFKLTCGAEINGVCTPTPFNFTTVDDFFSTAKAQQIKDHLLKAFPGKKTVPVLEMINCEDSIVSDYAMFLFENDYSLYTAKQWGVPASQIDPSVLKRVPIRLNYDVGYFDDEFQVMPRISYTEFFKSLLNHKNIECVLNTEALEYLKVCDEELYFNGEKITVPVVYTGALDELFELEYGQLPYRSLRFDWKYEEIDSKQNMPVVAYPQADGFTRIVEYKKLPVQNVKGTTYEVEYSIPYKSGEKNEPYYPVLTEQSLEQYTKYLNKASKIPNLYICGRLADFKYYNMDQALNRALQVADSIFD